MIYEPLAGGMSSRHEPSECRKFFQCKAESLSGMGCEISVIGLPSFDVNLSAKQPRQSLFFIRFRIDRFSDRSSFRQNRSPTTGKPSFLRKLHMPLPEIAPARQRVERFKSGVLTLSVHVMSTSTEHESSSLFSRFRLFQVFLIGMDFITFLSTHSLGTVP